VGGGQAALHMTKSQLTWLAMNPCQNGVIIPWILFDPTSGISVISDLTKYTNHQCHPGVDLPAGYCCRQPQYSKLDYLL